MPNFSNRAAYGDIYKINTSVPEQIAGRLLNEQKQREFKTAQEAANLDNMFAKNLNGIRDEDTDDVYDAYQRFKNLKIAAGRGRLGGKDRIKLDMDASRALADTWKVINDSKSTKKALADNAKAIVPKRDDYYGNALSIIESTNGVPTKDFAKFTMPDPNGEIDVVTGKVKLIPVDPRNLSQFEDRGNITKWQPVMQKIHGNPIDRNPISVEYKNNEGKVMGQTITPVKSKNSPVQVLNGLMTLAASKEGVANHFRNSHKDYINEETAPQIIANYEADRKDPVVIQAFGVDGLNINPQDLLNPVTRPMALYAMDYLNKNKPQVGMPKDMPNKVAVEEKQWARWLEKDALKNAEWDRRRPLKLADSLALIGARSKAGLPQIDTGYLTDSEDAEHGETVTWTIGGKPVTRRVVYADKIDPVRLAIINANGIIKPAQVKQPDGTYRAGYYPNPTTGDWEGADGKQISRERVKDQYVNKYSSSKFKNSVNTKGSENTKTPVSKPTTNSNKQKIPGF